MKRFILTIPIQTGRGLKKVHYECGDGTELLKNNRETSFPIIVPMSNAVKKDETIKVTALLIDREKVPVNYELFKQELDELANEIGFKYELNDIRMDDREDSKTHLKLFKDLAREFAGSSDEELYASITYGTKPMPMLMLMALTYAYKLCDSFTIESIVYGSMVHSTDDSVPPKCCIYDVSSLFYLNSAVNNMAGLDLDDPLALIDQMTNEEGEA